ncbi:MAG: ATP-binding protein [Bacillota bacterium]|jgi:signal transduction histidine kinase
MRSWRRSTAYRIAFANSVIFAGGLALLGIVVFAAMHIAFVRQLDATVSDEAQTLVDEYHSGGPGELAEAIAVRESSRSPTRLLYAVFTPDGRRIAGSLRTARPRLGTHDISFVDPREGADRARGIAIDLSPNERLLVAADREWVERIDRTVVGVFAVAFLTACIAAFGGAMLFGSYLRQRLSAISGTAKVVIAGDIRERMPLSGRGDEFDDLASTLNRMLDRIQRLVENLRQVSSDIAHDLRTPLSRLRTQLERSKQVPSDPVEVVDGAIAQLDQALALFAAILRIAEVEAGETRRYFSTVDMSALTAELAESYAPAVQDQGRTLLWSVKPDLKVLGDRELLAQAAANLIENAQRHTPPGTLIRVTLAEAGGSVCLQVIDNGPGVATADLPHIAKRFARLEASRHTRGYGLGLNLVSAVAKLHGGRLVLKNQAPGLSATIELPELAQPATSAQRQLKEGTA